MPSHPGLVQALPDASARDETNPYLARQNGPLPDLDVGAPVLQSSLSRGVNRRALVFLAGIAGLLLLAAAWLFHSATAGDSVARAPREEKIVIPVLPQVASREQTAASPPIALAAEAPPLPPLPLERALPAPQHADLVPASRMPSLRERRMGVSDAVAGSGDAGGDYARAMLAQVAAGSQVKAAPAAVPANATSAQYLQHPDALLLRGTYLRCVLETRIVTDIAGFTSCVVTEPVYSVTGRSLLLPKGSKVSGRYDTEPNGPRVSVVWDRITTPDGVDVAMSSPGVDNLGGAGHPGEYDAHWPSRISAALMISLISDVFKFEAAEHGPSTTTVGNGFVTQQPYQSSTARTLERLADQAAQRSLGRPATVTINQGTVVNIYVARDVDFSAVLAAR